MLPADELSVLAIEDNPADAMLLKEYLAMASGTKYGWHHCTSLTEGQNYLRSNAVDVVLLDLSLPDAFELSGVRKITGEFYDVCLIVITGNQNQKLGEDSLSIGAQDYLSKNDLTPEILNKSIKFAVHRKQSTRKLNFSLREQEALAEIAMVINQPRKFSSRINYTLDVLMGIFGPDATYIFELQKDKSTLKMTYGRVFPDFTPPTPFKFELKLADYPTFRKILEQGTALFSISGDEIPEDIAMEMVDQGIKDLFIMPIKQNGQPIGFLGGNYIRNKANALQIDENALITIARIISNGFETEHANKKKDEAIKLLTYREHQLHEAQTQAQMGSLVVNEKLSRFNASQSLIQLLQLEANKDSYPFSAFKRLIHPDDVLLFDEKMRNAIKSQERASLEMRIKGRGKSDFRYYWLVLLYERDGLSNKKQLKITIQDTHELANNRKKLQENEAILTEAQQIAQMGDWQKEVASKQFRISENLAKLLGFKSRKDLKMKDILRHIRKEDRHKIIALKNTLIEEGESEVRIYYEKDKTKKWLEIRGKTNYEPLLNAQVFRGTVQDITTNKTLNMKLSEAAHKYESLLSSIEGMVYRSEVSFPWKLYFVSEGGKEITGYDVSDIYAWPNFFKHIIHPDDIHQVSHFMTMSLENDNRFSVSYRIRHKNGSWRWVSDRGKRILLDGKEYLEGIIYDITERIMANELVTAAVMETESKERKRISRDIHDGMQQTLTSAFLQFEGMKGSIQLLDEKARLKYTQGQALLNKGIQESRAIAHQLMPLEIEAAGLLPSIETMVKTINETGLQANFECNGLNEDSLHSNIKLVIYRILQEAVNNIRKYAGPCEVQVQLFQYADKIMLTIEDNGKGFNTRLITGEQTGIGLASMKNRADAVGGYLEIDSRPGKGTNVFLEIPLVERNIDYVNPK